MKKKSLYRILLSSIVLLSSNYIASSKIPAAYIETHNNTQNAVYDTIGNYRDLYSDTWVATDALGRKMPDYEEVGPIKKDQRRITGMFYITWHTDNLADGTPPYVADVTNILNKSPEARLEGSHPAWHSPQFSYHWGEPEMGYFLSQDAYVIRKDISMLSDAGIDVLIMDVTNATRYWDEWNVLFSIMLKMKEEGNKVPQFCFWAYNGPVIEVVQDLYEKIYKTEKYKDLWFYWDNKPLLLYNGRPEFDAGGATPPSRNYNYDPEAKTNPEHPHYKNPDYCNEFYEDYTQEVKDFFTKRTMWWGRYEWGGQRYVGTEDNWSFGYELGDEQDAMARKMNPQDLVSLHNGVREQAAVTAGQHACTMVGKSWSRNNRDLKLDDYDMPGPTYVPWLGQTVENPTGYGIYFQERWDEALAANPQFIYLNDWNEWTAGKFARETDFMGRKSDYAFIDQYNAEYNRTIQPMKGGYTDNYYMQMVQNIRRYKGVNPIPENKGYGKIKIDAGFRDWETIETEYRDTRGDTFHRDHKGYRGLHYTNNSGRNDIITCKVAVDKKNIYFYVETDKNISPYTDNNWMLLLIDADNDSSTGWYGYDYILNKSVVDDKKTTLMRYNAESKEWYNIRDIEYRMLDNKMELSIPRALINLTENQIVFDFKWSDNPADLNDPISLCLNGDTAPNRRFNYRFKWKLK
ncbi:hypothetical protein D0T84_03445 [Dysgonomonas sp. 521]|uniref:hypothetical protein n=1 Tax=Dysgonomonas sp. 521 TaxID=2302932 RepID=UPI0013CF4986|nr:hypothetical protein [Dysgonomonas sp. 521]NDV93972.1 hypothetical protein [Dysgonomonas sp. 521]